jgi:nicotinamide mononucleotide adenylyltransferase
MAEDLLQGYEFPIGKLQTKIGTKKPVVLIACGSFSPITNMHLRLFELALDSLHDSEYEVIGQYMSPVTDAYGKKGLVSAKDRLEMCKLAAEKTGIMVDDWESRHSAWVPTRQVLDHFEEALKKALNGVRPEIWMICGTDLLDSFNTPGLWAEEDMEVILGYYGLVCVQRNQTNSSELISNNPLMSKHSKTIRIVNQWMNDITSSTALRYALTNGFSIRYLTPDPVIDYIYKNQLFDVPAHSRQNQFSV